MDVERRKFQRLSILADVAYKKNGAFQEEITLTKDLGAGGICIFATEELKVLDILELNISLPFEKGEKTKLFGIFPLNFKKTLFDKKKNVIVLGKVIWVKTSAMNNKNQAQRWDVGIEFINISESDKEMINKYVLDSMD